MKIFTCADTFEDMMSTIYTAWAAGIVIGHDNVRVMKEPVNQQLLFCEYIHVDYDSELTDKVIRSIQQKISMNAYISVYYACMSMEEDAFQTVYDFLRIGFKAGASVMERQNEPTVLRMMELRRRIGNESHSFIEFSRFTSVDNSFYLSNIAPKSNVLLLVANHFVDRMPSEHWMIVDTGRRLAVIHPKNSQYFMRKLSEEEFVQLCESYEREDSYTDMWKGFFEHISIKERENPRCQRNLFPIWKRTNAVEFG